MAYNKFITQDGMVALDLTSDTVTIETLAKGVTAHNKRGDLIVGIKEAGEIVEEYAGEVVISNEEEPSLPVWNGTDLTGTTWNVPSGWTAAAGYGIFSNLNYGFAINGENYGDSGWSWLCIGYYGSDIDWHSKTNSIAYSLPSEITNDSSITLTFNSGTDATNTSLISWLKTNGELTSHQTQEEPADETIVGTWKLDKVMTDYSVFNISVKFKAYIPVYENDVFNGLVTVNSSDDGYAGYGLISGDSTQYSLFYYGDMNAPNFSIEILEDVADANDRNTLLNWLKANATKQSTPTLTLISFTIDGTTYQAEEGMTWLQWLETDYNTANYTQLLLDGVPTVLIEPSGAMNGYGLSYNNAFIPVTETIVADRAYVKMYGSHGGGGNA